jgi:ribosomal protein S18 acetylase RimI-like enzyme
MKLRLCQKKDLKKIMKIIKEWKKDIDFVAYWDKEKNVKKLLRISPRMCWVVEINKEVVGFRLLMDDIQKRAWARLTIISKKHRREGIGSFLIKETDRKLKKMGFKKIYFETNYKNIASIKWHLKNKYKKVALIKDWYKKGGHGILFTKNL